MTIEENSAAGGFGSAVLEWSAGREGSETPAVRILGIPDNFQEHATRPELLADLCLDAEGIAARAGEFLGSRSKQSRTQNAS